MFQITVEAIRSAYVHMGYQPCQGEWRKEEDLACPQTTILELEGLISSGEDGADIETAADDRWGVGYANGFRDGWDGLGFLSRVGTNMLGPDYELGFNDGLAAATELLPVSET
jgi:hypothetical protein